MKTIFTLLFSTIMISLSAQQWQEVSALPNGFQTHHSFGFSIDDIGYLVTGSKSNSFSKEFYSYDSDTDTWTQKTDFPGDARGFAIGEVLDRKAYMGFGSTGNSNLNDLWVYDPDTDAWTELSPCECSPRTHPAFVAVNDFIYVGLGSNNANLQDWWAYDIVNDSWERRADYPAAARHHPYQFTDGEYVYVGNGHGNGFISNEWYRYDTANDTWEKMATMPAEGRVAGTQQSYGGLGYILSGDGDNHSFMQTGEFWRYDPTTNEWTELPPHPRESRWAPSSFIIKDEIYIINGQNAIDDFLVENYKLDISIFNGPRLRIMGPQPEDITYDQQNDQYCNPYSINTVEVNTPIAFDVDANVTITVDAASSAVEGVDFIMNEKTGVMPAGSSTLDFEILIFDDAVLNGDKTLVLNLDSDQQLEIPSTTVAIRDNDRSISTTPETEQAVVGASDGESIGVFGGYYTNMRNQLLYTREMMEQFSFNKFEISEISFNVTNKRSTIPYNDFTVRLALVDLDDIGDSFNNDLPFTEVYSGQLITVNGINTIQLDQSFMYDGVSDLVIDICFDNENYTEDDLVSTTSTSYNSMVLLQIDDVSGCPTGAGQSSTVLPVVTFGGVAERNIYTEVGTEFNSSIASGETIYFVQNDSIYAQIESLGDQEDDCFSSTLLSNNDQLINFDDLYLYDRVYSFSNDLSDDAEYNLYMVFPNTDALDMTSEELTGLYSSDFSTPDLWTPIEISERIENEKYTYIKVSYQGTGVYSIGGTEAILDVEDVLISELDYDEIMYFNTLGQNVVLDENKDATENIKMYIKSYLKNGVVIYSEKVIK